MNFINSHKTIPHLWGIIHVNQTVTQWSLSCCSSRSVALASGIRGLGTPAPLAATPGFLRRMAFILTTDRRFRLALGERALKRPQEIWSVVLENHDNSDGYEWRGTGRIVGDRYISGQWKSTKPGSPSAGLFVLAMGFEVATWLGSSLERRSPVQSWQVACSR